MAGFFINTGICWDKHRPPHFESLFPIVPQKYNNAAISTPILAEDTITRVKLANMRTRHAYSLVVSPAVKIDISSASPNACGLWLVLGELNGVWYNSIPFQVVMPSNDIAYIDTYMTGGADYVVGGNTYPHRIFFRLANLQIDTAEKVTKYDDERGTIIPLSATNYTTYSLQTMNTDAYTLAKLMKISNNDHITLNYIDADSYPQSVNLIRTSEAPTIERYPKMSSGSFSCKFVKA